ncbi:MAG TPA: hypothetical protein VKR52_04605 [Terracidiphilus sp.]|nr:hypothetical protein [Terracidiphilus sp.]
MTLDPVANFIRLTVSGIYGASDTAITVASLPSNFPTSGHCQLVWWNSTDYADPSNDPYAEIVRAALPASGNVLTVTRGQEGTNASAKNLSGKTYTLILGITAKMITDIGANLQQPWKYVNVDGTIDGVNTDFTLHGGITPYDPNSMQIRLARQPQEQGIDYTISGTTISYITPPDPSLAGEPHIAQYQ